MMTIDQPTTKIACGNRKHHGTDNQNQAHHRSVDEVRECFASGGVMSIEDAELMDAIGQYVDTLLAATPNDLRPTLSEGERETYRAQYAQEFLDVEATSLADANEFYAQHRSVDDIDWEAAEATPEPKAKPEPKAPVADRFDLVPDGIYTIEHESLRKGYATVRVRTQDKDDDFAPGKRIVGFLSGADNAGQYTGFAFLKGTDVHVWKRHQSNVDLMAIAALMSTGDPRTWLGAGHCYLCHRTLTTPESIAAGIGPTCAGRS